MPLNDHKPSICGQRYSFSPPRALTMTSASSENVSPVSTFSTSTLLQRRQSQCLNIPKKENADVPLQLFGIPKTASHLMIDLDESPRRILVRHFSQILVDFWRCSIERGPARVRFKSIHIGMRRYITSTCPLSASTHLMSFRRKARTYNQDTCSPATSHLNPHSSRIRSALHS